MHAVNNLQNPDILLNFKANSSQGKKTFTQG